jgi:hypothetical protein
LAVPGLHGRLVHGGRDQLRRPRHRIDYRRLTGEIWSSTGNGVTHDLMDARAACAKSV